MQDKEEEYIHAKTRPAYFPSQFALVFLGLFMFFYVHTNRQLGEQAFWIKIGLVLLILLYTLYLLLYKYKKIKLGSNAIEISGLFKHWQTQILYADILEIETRRIRPLTRSGYISDGYKQCTLHLRNGKSFSFDEKQFENFQILQNAIAGRMQNE